MIFYTDKFIPKRFAGYTIGFVILIRPKYKDDLGLLEHEKTHVKQYKRTYGLHGLYYLFNKKYRYNAELEAYRVQLRYYSDVDKIELNKLNELIDRFTNKMIHDYGLRDKILNDVVLKDMFLCL